MIVYTVLVLDFLIAQDIEEDIVEFRVHPRQKVIRVPPDVLAFWNALILGQYSKFVHDMEIVQKGAPTIAGQIGSHEVSFSLAPPPVAVGRCLVKAATIRFDVGRLVLAWMTSRQRAQVW